MTRSLVLLTVLALGCTEKPGRLVVFDGYGTPAELVLAGRLLEDRPRTATSSSARRRDNLMASWDALESDEIAGAQVRLTIEGREFEATTDADGRFQVSAKCGDRPFPLGVLPIVADVLAPEKHPTRPAGALAYVYGPGPGVLIISDLDDTLVDTRVRERSAMVSNTLLVNALQAGLIAGAPAVYRRAIEAGAGGVFYVSGSPHSLHDRLALFLSHHQLPRGPILLKNFGEDAIFAQDDYKLARIRKLLDMFPGHRFLLVGDNGERDPEIYAKIRTERPERIAGIVIRRAPNGDASAARAADMIVVDDYAADEGLLQRIIAP